MKLFVDLHGCLSAGNAEHKYVQVHEFVPSLLESLGHAEDCGRLKTRFCHWRVKGIFQNQSLIKVFSIL